MLEFFRKYQRYFFLVITVVAIASFTFSGTYSAFAPSEEKPDRVVATTIQGSKMMLSEVQKLSRFIATDREDFGSQRGVIPNFCNNGVIRYDFLKDRLATLLVDQYFDALKGDFESKLDQAKRFRPYAHPEAPFLSAKTVWDHLLPALSDDLASLQQETQVSSETFLKLSKLYLLQSQLNPETLRRILMYQHQQYPALAVDQRLSYEDLSLFGFHSASDWFGRHFVDLVSEFILNSASVAESKGYRVSLEEAKGDLIHTFQDTLQKMKGANVNPDVGFYQHLQMLGFDERSASEVWRKVLLFRKYFQDVGETAFVDRLPYKDFAGYAGEVAVVQKYEWPIQIRSAQDLAEFKLYTQLISKGGSLPSSFLSVEEVEKKNPNLVETTYRAQVAEIAKNQVGLRASLKQVMQWQMDHWAQLEKQFSLPTAVSQEERIKVLMRLDPQTCEKMDLYVRDCLVDENPSWIEESLASIPCLEKTWTVCGGREPLLKAENTYYRVENLGPVDEKHILPFQSARKILAKLAGKVEGECAKEKNPFAVVTKDALAALQKNPTDPAWIQSGTDPIQDQFKLVRKEQAISRTSKENWMKDQVFLMLPDFWSPIYVSDHGEVSFFYLQEKKVSQDPILEHLSFGKQTLAADAKAYVTEKILQTVKMKNAIVIPVQKEDE